MKVSLTKKQLLSRAVTILDELDCEIDKLSQDKSHDKSEKIKMCELDLKLIQMYICIVDKMETDDQLDIDQAYRDTWKH
jgi:hypothetical protein